MTMPSVPPASYSVADVDGVELHLRPIQDGPRILSVRLVDPERRAGDNSITGGFTTAQVAGAAEYITQRIRDEHRRLRDELDWVLTRTGPKGGPSLAVGEVRSLIDAAMRGDTRVRAAIQAADVRIADEAARLRDAMRGDQP